MKILLISWYFPPVNEVAALRTGALADYLVRRGHDVFVLTAARHGTDLSLEVTLASSRIIRTGWFDIDSWRLHARGETVTQSTPQEQADSSGTGPRRFATMRRWANNLYMNLLHVPDRQAGWYPFAAREGRHLLADNHFDLVYASGPSFVSFLVAAALSRQFGVPWIAEYRDGWSGDLYRPRSTWRNRLDRFLEERTLRSAAAVVTVSEPWADYFRKRFQKPTAAIYNGYDSEPISNDRRCEPNEPVVISYFGELYDGLRDPTPLYEAIKHSRLTPHQVQIHFYGPKEKKVRPLAERLGVSEYVLVKPRVTHAEALQIQNRSDVLMLLQAPGDPRNVPAKIFEYFAARRPILGLGLDDGIPARMIRERRAGAYTSDPGEIARQLQAWIVEKKTTGLIADTPEKALAGLSRVDQLLALEQFLQERFKQVAQSG